MINISNVYKSYGSLKVLNGIDLAVPHGEVISIIGASGSGKSTLLYCINALEQIDSGNITVDGIDVHDRKTDANQLRKGLGMVFQQWNAFPHMTALENVSLGPRVVLKMPKEEAQKTALAQLEHVGLIDKAHSYPKMLSGGQLQRMAIARALAMSPRYLLLDEVTSALDPELVGEVLETIRKLSDEGMTMIVVTHEINFAREVSDKIAFFHKGVVEELGSPEQVIDNPSSEHAQKFLANHIK